MIYPLLLTFIALVILLYFEYKNDRSGAYLTKPLASFCFLWAAFNLNLLQLNLLNEILIMALIFCFIGDVLLLPKSKSFFKIGILTFLAGHVAFIGAFFQLDTGINFQALTMGLILTALIGFLAGRWMWPYLTRNFKIPIIFYITIISLMVSSSLGVIANGASPYFLMAALMFYFSDLFVARNRFVAPGFINRLIGLPLYYGAVYLFIYTFSTLQK